MPSRAAVAAYFHKRMCNDSRFGYTQGGGRWGSGALERWTYDGVTGQFQVGDRDCSSSVIDCWQEALRGSAYEGALAGATYTGNMRSVFVGSGLFEWKPMSFTAQTGDIYLNESDHTAMCQTAEPDVLSEFLINEHGTITGGRVGDQTGWESVVRGYYDFPWNGILHYNGKADGDMEKTELISTKDDGNIPAWQAWSWAYTYAKNSQPHNIWEYYWKDAKGNNTAPGGNMYNCVVHMSEKIDKLSQTVDNLKVIGATVDYDKLAEKLAPAVADEFYARMKQ